MINTKNILNMVKHVARNENALPDKRIMHPEREWFIGITGVLIGIIVGSIFAYLVFHSYSLLTTQEIVVTETVVPYKAVLVEKALTLYLEKRSVYNNLIDVTVPQLQEIEAGSSAASTTATTTPIEIPTEVTTNPAEIKENETTINVPEEEESTITPDLAI